MRRFLVSVLACGALLVGTLASSALAQDAETSRVVVLQVAGPLDAIVEDYIVSGIEAAEDDGSTVVIQIDSPGTLDRDPMALATRVHGASVPVLVWVGPGPSTPRASRAWHRARRWVLSFRWMSPIRTLWSPILPRRSTDGSRSAGVPPWRCSTDP